MSSWGRGWLNRPPTHSLALKMRQGSEVWAGGGSRVSQIWHWVTSQSQSRKLFRWLKGSVIWQDNRTYRKVFWDKLEITAWPRTSFAVRATFCQLFKKSYAERKGGRMGQVKGRWWRGWLRGARGVKAQKDYWRPKAPESEWCWSRDWICMRF